MKNYEEMSHDVFCRINEYNEKKKKKSKIITRTLVPTLSICLVALLGLGAWQGGMFTKAPIQSAEDAIAPGTKDWYGPDESNADMGEKAPYVFGGDIEGNGDKQGNENKPSYAYDKIIWAEQTKGETSNVNIGFKIRAGKMTSYTLIKALEKAKTEDVFAISLGRKEVNTFKFNGKTLYEYENEISGGTLYKKKLALLLKEGESLKYGEALYTTGTPTGEKWSENQYKDRIDFYGKEFLSKFIVNGEFLKDKVENEIVVYDDSHSLELREANYEKAKMAYREQILSKIATELENQNMCYQYSSDNLIILIFATAECYDGFKINDSDDFLFGLATKSGEVTTDTNTK